MVESNFLCKSRTEYQILLKTHVNFHTIQDDIGLSTYLSFDPSGRMNLGTSTNNLHPIRTVSQTKVTVSQTLTFTDRRHPSIPTSQHFTAGFSSLLRHRSKSISLTGGTVTSPTPLPSVLWADTCTAWDTSGAMPRPCTQLYTELRHRHQPKHCKSVLASNNI